MSSLFGGSAPQVQYQPKGFTGGGLSYSPSGQLSQSPQLTSQIGGLQSTFGQQAQALGGLGQTVAPGFSQLRQAGLATLQAGKSSALGDLRQNLAQRRVLGSSFASDAEARTSAQYDQQAANFQAQSYLQELESSFQITQAQYQAATQQFSTGIQQMNFEAGLAANLTTSNNQINAQIATANANLQMQQQQMQQQALGGIGSLVGTLGTARTSGGGSLFGDLASAAMFA